MQLSIDVEYRDPSGKTVTQNAVITLADYAAWERKSGKVIQSLQTGMGVNDLLFLAWHRLVKTKKENRDYETWVESVENVSSADMEPTNPTEAAASDAS